jgi:hypothetical protein
VLALTLTTLKKGIQAIILQEDNCASKRDENTEQSPRKRICEFASDGPGTKTP